MDLFDVYLAFTDNAVCPASVFGSTAIKENILYRAKKFKVREVITCPLDLGKNNAKSRNLPPSALVSSFYLVRNIKG